MIKDLGMLNAMEKKLRIILLTYYHDKQFESFMMNLNENMMHIIGY